MTLPHAACLLHCIADHRNCKAKSEMSSPLQHQVFRCMHNSLCICSFSSSTLVLSSIGFPFSAPSRWVAAADFLGIEDWKWNELEDKTRQQYDLLFAMTTGGAKFVIREVQGADGIAQWHALAKRYARRSLARVMRRLHKVMNLV